MPRKRHYVVCMYTCVQRQIKHPINLLFSVLGVSPSITMTISVVFISLAARFEYRPDLCQHGVDLERNNNARNPVNNRPANARNSFDDRDQVAQDPQVESIALHELPITMSTRDESTDVQARTSATTGGGN